MNTKFKNFTLKVQSLLNYAFRNSTKKLKTKMNGGFLNVTNKHTEMDAKFIDITDNLQVEIDVNL